MSSSNGDKKVIVEELVVGKRPAISKWKKWEPTEWLPIFDQMIICSVAGESNNSIAKRFKYTPQHVSTILNLPRAKLLRRQMYESLQKGIVAKTEDRLAHIQDRAISRVTQVLDNDELAKNSPFAMMEKSITVLKGLGVLKPDTPAGGINAKNAVFITPELSQLVGDALRKSDEAKQLNGKVEVDVTRKD